MNLYSQLSNRSRIRGQSVTSLNLLLIKPNAEVRESYKLTRRTPHKTARNVDTNQKGSPSERTIACSNCGQQLDRDLNSVLNILAKFYLQKEQFGDLLHEPSVNEESFFHQWKGFLRQTANGKTKVSLSKFWMRFSGLVGSPVR